jgi:hypothetical protein
MIIATTNRQIAIGSYNKERTRNERNDRKGGVDFRIGIFFAVFASFAVNMSG